MDVAIPPEYFDLLLKIADAFDKCCNDGEAP
jgi:hypothetical protein